MLERGGHIPFRDCAKGEGRDRWIGLCRELPRIREAVLSRDKALSIVAKVMRAEPDYNKGADQAERDPPPEIKVPPGRRIVALSTNFLRLGLWRAGCRTIAPMVWITFHHVVSL
ncbi:hypothetical protein N5W20_05985 [Candidatus Kirkpatrickella diaphorinae]|uniref:Transposase n=1 Tax=Candidatus Kirkpatrickella diaphorinae TaxID=2984322 RepID=A0ABY6GGY8_9PROT|nr:hypothetical protein [Candidatus Kirkpatrickella diaphorinae]UYH50670.1 hypothetical protein N5W20_05985 [Candidatus Kirkpatrickella diaphorinae]